MLSITTQSTNRQPRKWTPEEDHKLRNEVEAQLASGEAKDWCRISMKLPGRTNKDCRKRWHNSVAGGLKKGQWSKSEDRQLAKGVERYGQRWTLVADVVHSRSADQCAKRWQQSLDPCLDHSEWRESKDKLLIEAVQRHGRHWKDIQHHYFQGRSKNDIKNRYTVLIRRYQNKGIVLPQSAATPEPNEAGSHNPKQIDTFSFASDIADDVFLSSTPISSPEFEGAPSNESITWDTPPPYITLGSSIPDYPTIHQQPTSAISHDAQWSWNPPTMNQPVPLQSTSSNNYAHFDHAATYASYDPYASLSATHSPALSHQFDPWDSHILTSSPSATSAASAHPDLQSIPQYAFQSQHMQSNYPYHQLPPHHRPLYNS
ncbi:unnamed protein product [Periconia digitata]|uniref:Uncharacterized protein n=1 Tax=Periconia digitata TaxID=1303443 RepID=A0A9W4UE84_9PLEO|nr:unnamed protein product [Periconia digitata]